MLICGATTMETSEKAGREAIGELTKGWVTVGTNPDGLGGWRVPRGNDFASMETTSDSDRPDRLSQLAAVACETGTAIAPGSSVARIKFLIRVLTDFLLLGVVHGLERRCAALSHSQNDGNAGTDRAPRHNTAIQHSLQVIFCEVQLRR